MIAKLKIKDIANTSSGYTFREAIKESLDGNIFVLQAKDINQKEYFQNTEKLIKTSVKIPRSNSYLKYNDVLLTSRGSGVGSFKSTVFKSNDKNVVASSSINIIRIKDNKVLPEYLSMYLSSTDGQKLILNILSGSYIKTILRKNLEEIKIPIPPIEKQKAITLLNKNIRKQEIISERINQIKQNITNASLRNLIIN